MAQQEWTSTEVALPPERVVVETQNSTGEVTELVFEKGLWFFPDFSMYVYYVPRAWRHRTATSTANQ